MDSLESSGIHMDEQPDFSWVKMGQEFNVDDGRVYVYRGLFRPAKKGEIIVGPMSALLGPAEANRDTEVSYPILELQSMDPLDSSGV